MTNLPFFSIIIPTYNAGKFIRTALHSILSQSFSNFEILIIDGVSNDDTIRVASEFQDERIKIFCESDKGIYDAMNKGITLAKGSWLFFLGSDDSFYDDNVLERIEENIKNSELEIAYGNVSSPLFGGIYGFEIEGKKLQKRNICHQSIFFKKTIFNLTGPFDVSFTILADWDHNFKWFFDRRIRKKYFDITIANYGEFGLSSRELDTYFLDLIKWRYAYAQKYNYSRFHRLKLIYHQIRQLHKQKSDWRCFVRVILESPKFLF